uniref:Uncharacterized protein n=1 Tax=Ascaris lumbricoides TaxID=6252 RepID=A0A9J2P615_ASCLU
MPNFSDFLPDILLAIMGLLGLVRIERFLDAFAAMAALLEEDVEELYYEVGLFIQERWREDFAALDVHGRGLQYFVCRLAHCGVSGREFETVADWKRHVALARSHIKDAFCGNCGHHLVVPPGIDAANLKAFMTAHKEERCVGASKTTIRQRHAEVTRLEGLMRNTSHIFVPGSTAQNIDASLSPQWTTKQSGSKWIVHRMTPLSARQLGSSSDDQLFILDYSLLTVHQEIRSRTSDSASEKGLFYIANTQCNLVAQLWTPSQGRTQVD